MLIHGRYDVSSPLETAWRLRQRWSTSELRVIPTWATAAAARSWMV